MHDCALAGLARLKKQPSENIFLGLAELDEVKRLLSDMGKGAKEVATDRELLELFANQLSVRMNNQRRYRAEEVVTALRDTAG